MTPAGSETAESPEAQALVATHWFDSGEGGEPYSATVRFTGRRVGARGIPGPRDLFAQEEKIDRVVPGTGPVSITTWVYGLEPGEWAVSAQIVDGPGGAYRLGSGTRSRAVDTHPVHPARWSWRRWAIFTGPETPIKTRWALLAPIAAQPAVMPGIYTLLAVLGIAFALVVQAAILGSGEISVGRTLAASAIAITAGLIGAKLWYAVLHPDESIIKGGWAVDGFLMVVPVAAAVILLIMDLPIGAVLDASTPGIFFAVVIGRIGCFFTGCCAGRCTASRWGIWSSDRRVGARRVPTQLIESGAGLAIGIAALFLVLGGMSPVTGSIFVTAFAAYAVVRQILLRLRVEQRRSPRTVPLTGLAAVVVALAVITMAIRQGRPTS